MPTELDQQQVSQHLAQRKGLCVTLLQYSECLTVVFENSAVFQQLEVNILGHYTIRHMSSFKPKLWNVLSVEGCHTLTTLRNAHEKRSMSHLERKVVMDMKPKVVTTRNRMSESLQKKRTFIMTHPLSHATAGNILKIPYINELSVSSCAYRHQIAHQMHLSCESSNSLWVHGSSEIPRVYWYHG